jgi:hypothetical protein
LVHVYPIHDRDHHVGFREAKETGKETRQLSPRIATHHFCFRVIQDHFLFVSRAQNAPIRERKYFVFSGQTAQITPGVQFAARITEFPFVAGDSVPFCINDIANVVSTGKTALRLSSGGKSEAQQRE